MTEQNEYCGQTKVDNIATNCVKRDFKPLHSPVKINEDN